MELLRSCNITYLSHRQGLEAYLQEYAFKYTKEEIKIPFLNIYTQQRYWGTAQEEEKIISVGRQIYDRLKIVGASPVVYEIGFISGRTWSSEGPRNKKEQHSVFRFWEGREREEKKSNYISLSATERNGAFFCVNIGARQTLTNLEYRRRKPQSI